MGAVPLGYAVGEEGGFGGRRRVEGGGRGEQGTLDHGDCGCWSLLEYGLQITMVKTGSEVGWFDVGGDLLDA